METQSLGSRRQFGRGKGAHLGGGGLSRGCDLRDDTVDDFLANLTEDRPPLEKLEPRYSRATRKDCRHPSDGCGQEERLHWTMGRIPRVIWSSGSGAPDIKTELSFLPSRTHSPDALWTTDSSAEEENG